MSTTETKIVISLMHGSNEREYTICDLQEARELVRRKTVNGFRYTLLPTYYEGGRDDKQFIADHKAVFGKPPFAV